MRLRYSVVWASERLRLRAALSPPSDFVVPARRDRGVSPSQARDCGLNPWVRAEGGGDSLQSCRARAHPPRPTPRSAPAPSPRRPTSQPTPRLRQLGAAIDFALRGEDYDDSHFSFQVFLAHVYEHKNAIKAAILAPIAAVEALVMYEAPLASLLACSFWQAACSHPPLLVSVPSLSLLWLLLHNWRAERVDQPAVQRAPGLSSLIAAALLPIWWQRPMVVPRPDLRAPDQRAPGGFGGAPTQAALVARRAEEAASAAAEKAQLQEAAELMEKELHAANRRRPSGLLGAVKVNEKAQEDKEPTKRDATDVLTDPTLLLEPYLGWVQVMLGGYVLQLRAVRGVLCWHDPGLTLWLFVALAVAALVAPLLPWLLMSRCLGALLLGPHMWAVGARRRGGAAVAKAAAADALLVYTASGKYYETGLVSKYQFAANLEERAAIVAAARKEYDTKKAEAAAAAEKAAAAMPYAAHGRLRREHSLTRCSGVMFEVHGARTAQEKFSPALPDPARSSAAALRRR